MKKILLLILALSFDAFASQRRRELLEILNEELKEVSRLNRQTKNSRPILILNAAEMNLEKARLLKEEENEKFLRIHPDKRKKMSKKNFYKESRSYFIRAQKLGYFILKKFPRFKRKGEVYYILAYNAYEFSQVKMAKKFFNKALKNSKKGSRVQNKSMKVLAKIYFNEKKYAKAAPLYERVLSGKKDQWYTKDLFNLSWCYFRTGKKDRAIREMQRVYELSDDENFIDMKYAVERDLAYFYTDSGRTDEAIAFYRKVGKNVSENLIKVAKFLITQGQYTSAQKALLESLKLDLDTKSRIEVHFALLNLYDKYKKDRSHLDVAKKLVKEYEYGNLSKKETKDLLYHVERNGALLLKRVAAKAYKKLPKKRAHFGALAGEYFSLLMILQPSKAISHEYFSGESYYAAGEYEKALEIYENVRKKSIKKGNKKFYRMAVTGMLACLGNLDKISKEKADRYFPIVYAEYIKLNPKTQKASKLLQRLFSFYIKKGKIISAEKQFSRFVTFFPRDYKIHEAMFSQVIDYYKAKKDNEGIKKWFLKLKNGEVKVSKKYGARLQKLLLSLQFEGAEKHHRSGDKANALKGYVKIYHSQETTREAKRNAAYNIAVLFHEMGNLPYLMAWANRAMSMMQGKEIARFSGSFIVMISDIYNQLEFKMAHKMYTTAFEKLCLLKNRSKNIFLKNYMTIGFIDERIPVKGVDDLGKTFKRCNINKSTREEILKSYVSWASEGGHFQSLLRLEKLLSQYRGMEAPLAFVQSTLASNKKHSRLLSSAESNFRKAIKNKKSVRYEVRTHLVNFRLKEISKMVGRFELFRPKFPRNIFSTQVTNQFKLLSKIKSKVDSLYDYGEGGGIVKGHRWLVQSYDTFIRKLLEFTPKGFTDQHLKQFKEEMKSVAITLKNDQRKIKSSIKKLIFSEEILSRDNQFFLEGQSPLAVASLKKLVMDRLGGRKK